MRFIFLASLVTVWQRQLAWSTLVRISVSMAVLTAPTEILLLSLVDTLEVSMMQYNVSVIVDGVVPWTTETLRSLVSYLDGFCTMFAYVGLGLEL